MPSILNNSDNHDFFLYVYLIKNQELISCQGCCVIPYGKNTMYRIKNTKIIYCKECINKWLYKYNNPTTGIKLNEKDIEINYEINNLIEIYIKHKTLDIKNININITINKNIR